MKRQYFDDFSKFDVGQIEHATDGLLQDHSYASELSGTNWYIECVSDIDAIGGKRFDFNRTSNGSGTNYIGLSGFSTADGAIELVTRVKIAVSRTINLPGFKSVSDNAKYGGSLSTTALSIYEYSDAWTTQETVGTATVSIDPTDWVWIRARLEEDKETVRYRVWQGTTEPSDWMVDGKCPVSPITGDLYPILLCYSYLDLPYSYDIFGAGLNTRAPRYAYEVEEEPTRLLPIKKPWTKQPPANTPIDRSHPLAPTNYILPGHLGNAKVWPDGGVFEMQSGGTFVRHYSPQHGVGIHCYGASSGADYIELPLDNFPSSDFMKGGSSHGPFSYLMLVQFDTQSSTHSNNLLVRRDSSSDYFLYEEDGYLWTADSYAQGTQIVPGGVPVLVGCHKDGGGSSASWSLSVGGEKESNVITGDYTIGLSAPGYIGGRGDTLDSRLLRGKIYGVFIWENRELTEPEIAQFAENPWQIFKPKTIYAPIDEPKEEVLPIRSRITYKDRSGEYNGTSDWTYSTNDETPLSEAPMTFSAWAKTSNTTDQMVIFNSADAGDTRDAFEMGFDGSAAGDLAYALKRRSNSIVTWSTGQGYKVNEWNHVVARFFTDRVDLFLNGTKFTDGNTHVPTTIDRIAVGSRARAQQDNWFPGLIANLGAWSVPLTDAEILELYRGARPNDVRLEGLVFNSPDGLVDETGVHPMVNDGVTQNTDAPSILPRYSKTIYAPVEKKERKLISAPRVWTKQPPAGTPLDPSNKFVKGMTFCFNGADFANARDVVSKERHIDSYYIDPDTLTSVGNYPSYTSKGVAAYGEDNDPASELPTSFHGQSTDRFQTYKDTDELSVYTLALSKTPYSPPAHAAILFYAIDDITSFGSPSIQIVDVAGFGLAVSIDDFNLFQFGTSPFISTSEVHSVGFSARRIGTSTSMEIYVDGAIAGTDSTTSTPLGYHDDFVIFGPYGDDGEEIEPCGLILSVAWNRSLSQVEQAEFDANPWQIFKPKTTYALEEAEKPDLITFERPWGMP